MVGPGTAPVQLAVLDSRDATKPPRHVAQAPHTTPPPKAPNPFYAHSSVGLLALSRN